MRGLGPKLIAIVLVLLSSSVTLAKKFDWVFQNRTGRTLNVELYSTTRNQVWPGDGTVWVVPPDGRRYTNRITCNAGEYICYGGWDASNESTYWGAGKAGKESCSDCCYYCRGQSTRIINFIYRANPPAVVRKEPPPAQLPPRATARPSFDCSDAHLPAEQALCSSEQLAELDRKIAAAYNSLLNKAPSKRKSDIKEGQRAFLRARNACGDQQSCLALQLQLRMAALSAQQAAGNASPDGAGPPFQPSQPSGALAESSSLNPANAEDICQHSFGTLQSVALGVSLAFPGKQEISAGEIVTIAWKTPPMPAAPGERGIYLQLDLPSDAEVPRGLGENWRESQVYDWDPNYRSQQGLAMYYPTSPHTKRVTIRLDPENGPTRKSLSLRFPGPGTARITAQITAGTSYTTAKERANCSSAALTLPVTTELRIVPAQRYDTAQPCHLTQQRTSQLVSGVKLTRSKPTESIASGEALALSWSVGAEIDVKCKTPLYLLLSFPNSVRFSGDGFFALMPEAKGPFGINHDKDRVRVFVPLHLGKPTRNGTLLMTFYQTGQWPISAALVEVPAWTSPPLHAANLAGDRPIVAPLAGSPFVVDVRAGSPRIVVQDQYTTETPVRTAVANSGDYVLQVFPEYYRVLDHKTGDLVVQRTGTDPEFSMSGRFISALFENQHSLEVIDLVSGTRVGGFRSEEQGSYIGRGVLPIAWGRNDSFLLSAPLNGDGLLYSLLVDREPVRVVASNASKHGTVKTALIYLDLENQVLAALRTPEEASKEEHVESLLEASKPLSNETSARAASAFLPDFELIARHWPEFTISDFRWDLGDDTQYAHAPNRPDLSAALKEVDRGNWADEAVKASAIADAKSQYTQDLGDFRYLDGLRVKHDEAAPSQAQPLTLAANRLTLVRSLTRNPEAANSVERLSALTSLVLKPNLPKSKVRGQLYKHAYVEDYEGDTSWDNELTAVLLEHVNSDDYQKFLRKWSSERGGTDQPKFYDDLTKVDADFACQYDTPEGSFGQFVSPLRVIGRTGWRNDESRFWLIQQDCWGGSGWREGQIGLLVKRGEATPQFISLTEDRTKSNEIDPLGLNSAKLARGWITDDEVLLVATPNGTIVVLDIATGKRLALLKNVEGAEFSADLWLTKDRSKLMMLTEGGKIGIFDLIKGSRLLSGYYVDDELIFYNDDGYYLSTPEGAHFVNVKFPGLSGYNTVHQFARTLNRPDVIRAILAGKPAPEKPHLTPPPQLEIVTTPKVSGTGRAAMVHYKVSSVTTQLARLVVYADGRPIKEVVLSGDRAKGDVDLALAPEARWISAVAIDVSGYESVPQVQALNAEAKPTGRLFVIAVGTDRYDHLQEQFQLTGAVRDAKSFLAAAKSLQGTIYSDVVAKSLLDAGELKTSLPLQLREIVSEAGPEDTIMLFAAGHGMQGEDHRFYLVGRSTSLDAISTTALAWEEVGSAFDGLKGRVIVFLDACRSGSVAGAGTNDDAVSALIGGRPPITVIAAAKGRQDSEEGSSGEGGYFTNAVIRAITADRSATDSNSNGAIELTELYGVVKRTVLRETEGRQTPWIARNQMVGEIPLF